MQGPPYTDEQYARLAARHRRTGEALRTGRERDHIQQEYRAGLMLFELPIARDWLESSNAYLDGALPVDVLQLRGSADVVAALGAAAAGVLG